MIYDIIGFTMSTEPGQQKRCWWARSFEGGRANLREAARLLLEAHSGKGY